MTRAKIVTIAGGGILGLSAAWALIRRGIAVRVFETARIGAGSSGGQVGALAPHAPENWNAKKQFQLESLLAAARFWDEVAQIGGVDPGYARLGRIQPVAAGAEARMQARCDGAQQHWPEGIGMRLTRSPDHALLPVSESGLYLVDDLTARLSPRGACAALAAAIRARGGEIIEGSALTLEDSRAPVIWATGATGLAALSTDLDRNIGTGIKGQSASLAHAAPDAPQLFVDGLHLVPHADGTLALGSTSEREFDHSECDDQIDALIAQARSLCPAISTAPVIERWAGIRPRARSRAPLMGAWPGRAGHYVLNGGFKIGFGMAPALADVIADLVTQGRDTIPEGFRLAAE